MQQKIVIWNVFDLKCPKQSKLQKLNQTIICNMPPFYHPVTLLDFGGSAIPQNLCMYNMARTINTMCISLIHLTLLNK